MILVIGGSGSGKSAYAEKVALECQKEKRHFYLATMHVFGEEGQKNILSSNCYVGSFYCLYNRNDIDCRYTVNNFYVITYYKWF